MPRNVAGKPIDPTDMNRSDGFQPRRGDRYARAGPGQPPGVRQHVSGSAMVIWDGGTPAPPTTNTPPNPPQYGADPHEFPRNDRAARQQKSDFLQIGGSVTDVCNGTPCTIDFNPNEGWTGPPPP